AADGCHLAARQHLGVALELECVRHRLLAEAINRHRDVEHVVEARRLEVIAARGNAREADSLALPRQRERDAAYAQEFALAKLHEAEEIREVHDPGHVGVVELYPACDAEWRHARYFPRTARVASAIARALNCSKTACLPCWPSFSRSAESSP